LGVNWKPLAADFNGEKKNTKERVKQKIDIDVYETTTKETQNLFLIILKLLAFCSIVSYGDVLKFLKSQISRYHDVITT